MEFGIKVSIVAAIALGVVFFWLPALVLNPEGAETANAQAQVPGMDLIITVLIQMHRHGRQRKHAGGHKRSCSDQYFFHPRVSLKYLLDSNHYDEFVNTNPSNARPPHGGPRKNWNSCAITSHFGQAIGPNPCGEISTLLRLSHTVRAWEFHNFSKLSDQFGISGVVAHAYTPGRVPSPSAGQFRKPVIL